ncbi:hypothetical protein [Mesorhizobium loti]|uniref:Uncharacterized protein n=1 Tax=Mesorhizobium loti R88b TaxID=935548 RepID=A0A6M7WPT2_RHILI|nr:hypothetical protein [Mesorhizobium loti]QKD03526.1 hypothetical protein EB235_20220 [Mesorhizobium loti R88b]
MNSRMQRDFGKRTSNVASSKSIVVTPGGPSMADYAFYGALGLPLLAVIGFLGVLLKDPPSRDDKLAPSQPATSAYDGGLLTEATRVDPGEPVATYTVQKVTSEGAGIVNVINSRYSDNTGAWFTNARYDCNKGTRFTLAGGESQSSMSTKSNDYKWAYLVDGSSASFVARFACSRAGLKLHVSD